ncbi:MAG TPA: circadian clock KaiB family protein [Polyangiaceae bacterium]|nr:circadian clock KaiB family protein [Polyangiaceae bacterium]
MGRTIASGSAHQKASEEVKPRARSASSTSKTASNAKVKRKEVQPELAETSDLADSRDVWTLRLYVAGDSPKSRTALANLKRLCAAQRLTDFKIEVVDLKKRPELAKADQILAVPTLIRKIPEPMKRIIGDLSNADRALVALELDGV